MRYDHTLLMGRSRWLLILGTATNPQVWPGSPECRILYRWSPYCAWPDIQHVLCAPFTRKKQANSKKHQVNTTIFSCNKQQGVDLFPHHPGLQLTLVAHFGTLLLCSKEHGEGPELTKIQAHDSGYQQAEKEKNQWWTWWTWWTQISRNTEFLSMKSHQIWCLMISFYQLVYLQHSPC